MALSDGYHDATRPEAMSSIQHLVGMEQGLLLEHGAFERRVFERPAEHTDEEEVLPIPKNGGLVARLAERQTPPDWLTQADVEFYVAEYSRTGFRGGLNW